MHNTTLDEIGGEPLVGSGFEYEEPDDDFEQTEEGGLNDATDE